MPHAVKTHGPMATGERHSHDIDEPKSRRSTSRLRIKNRRKRYLDLHPEYFSSAEIELADPLLYDRLVRRYQTTYERECQGRARGFTGSMETDLVRSEAKLEALRHPDPNSPIVYRRAADGSIAGMDSGEQDEPPDRDDAWRLWTDVMGQRFLRGDDGDFDYGAVDLNEEFDDRAEEDRRAMDEYIEGQTAEFVGKGPPEGETGVQDF